MSLQISSSCPIFLVLEMKYFGFCSILISLVVLKIQKFLKIILAIVLLCENIILGGDRFLQTWNISTARDRIFLILIETESSFSSSSENGNILPF